MIKRRLQRNVPFQKYGNTCLPPLSVVWIRTSPRLPRAISSSAGNGGGSSTFLPSSAGCYPFPLRLSPSFPGTSRIVNSITMNSFRNVVRHFACYGRANTVSCSQRWSSSMPSFTKSSEQATIIPSESADDFLSSMETSLDDYEALLLQTEEEAPPADSNPPSWSVCAKNQPNLVTSPDQGEMERVDSIEKPIIPSSSANGACSVSSSVQITATLLEMIKDVLPEDGKLMRLTDLSPSVDLELLERLPSSFSSGNSSDSSAQRVSLLGFLRMHPRHFNMVQVEESLPSGGTVKRWHVRAQLQGVEGGRKIGLGAFPRGSQPECGANSGNGSAFSSSSNNAAVGGAHRGEGDQALDTLDVSSLFLEEEMKDVLKSASCAQRKIEREGIRKNDAKETLKYEDRGWKRFVSSSSSLPLAGGTTASPHGADGARLRRRLQPVISVVAHEWNPNCSSNGEGGKEGDEEGAAWMKECRMVWQRVADLLKPGEILSAFQLRARLQEADPEVLEWLRDNSFPPVSGKNPSAFATFPSAAATPSATSHNRTSTGFRRLLWQHRHIAKEFLDYNAISVEGWVSVAGKLKATYGADHRTTENKTPPLATISTSIQCDAKEESKINAGEPPSLIWTKGVALPSTSPLTDASGRNSVAMDEQFADDWVVELNLDEEEEEESLWSVDEVEDVEEGHGDRQQEGEGQRGGQQTAPVSSSIPPPLTKKQRKQLLRARANAEKAERNVKNKKEKNLAGSLSLASPDELLAEHTRLAEERGWYTPAEILDLLVECVPAFPVPMDQLISSDALLKLFGFNLSMRRVVLVYRYYFLVDAEVLPVPTICLHPERVVGIHPQAGVANVYYKKWEHVKFEKRLPSLSASNTSAVPTFEKEVPCTFSSSVVETNDAGPSPITTTIASKVPANEKADNVKAGFTNSTGEMWGGGCDNKGGAPHPSSKDVVLETRGNEKESLGGISPHPSNTPTCLPEAKSPAASGEASKASTRRGAGSPTSGGVFASLRRTIKSKVILPNPKKREAAKTQRMGSSTASDGLHSTAKSDGGASVLHTSSSIPLPTSNSTADRCAPSRTASSELLHSLPRTNDAEQRGEALGVSRVRGRVPLSDFGVAMHDLTQGGSQRIPSMKDAVPSRWCPERGANKSIAQLSIMVEGAVQQTTKNGESVPIRRDLASVNLLQEALQLIYENDGEFHEEVRDPHSHTSSDTIRSTTSRALNSSPMGEILAKLLLVVPYTHFIPLEEVAVRCGTDVDTLEDLFDRSQPTQSRYAAFLLHTTATTTGCNGSGVGGRPPRRRRLVRFRPLWVAPNSTGDLAATASSTSSSGMGIPASFLRKLLPTWRPLYRIVESMPAKDRDQLLNAALHSSSLAQYLSLFGCSPCWVEEPLGGGVQHAPPPFTSGKERKENSLSSSSSTAWPPIDHLVRVRRYTGDLEMDDIEAVGLRALYYCCHPHEYRTLEAVLKHAQSAEYLARKRFGLPTSSTTTGGSGGNGLVLGEGIANMLSELSVIVGEETQSLPRRISRHPTLFEVSGNQFNSLSTSSKAQDSFRLKRRTIFTTTNFSNGSHKKN